MTFTEIIHKCPGVQLMRRPHWRRTLCVMGLPLQWVSRGVIMPGAVNLDNDDITADDWLIYEDYPYELVNLI